MAKVTVIVPNYNHDRFLNLRLGSVLSQSYQDFEVIILDDCSTDNSREIIEQYRNHPKISKIVYNDKNTGSPFKQWVKGILLAKSEYLWIAESDDYADKNFLYTMINLTEAHPNVAVAYCDSYKVDANDCKNEDIHCYMDREFKNGAEEVKNLCQYNTITNASACIIKREYALKALDGLEEFQACGDWIFYSRVLQFGNLAHTPRKLNYYRWHPGSVSYTACKTSVYLTEGIKVVKYIDFNVVRLSMFDFISLSRAWISKIFKMKFRYQMRSAYILMLATYRFFLAKMHL